MSVAPWIALGVLVVTVTGGLVLLGLRALDTWRAFRSFRRTVLRGLGDVSRRAAGAERRFAHVAENAAKLERAGVRLERSLSTAAVLADAAAEARGAVRRARGVIPHK